MADARDKPHDLLPRVGEAMWGARWQSDMAEALTISDRTVRRWVAGERIPSGVWLDLMRLMQERSFVLDGLTDEAKEVGGGTT
jgi:hypothetical protein